MRRVSLDKPAGFVSFSQALCARETVVETTAVEPKIPEPPSEPVVAETLSAFRLFRAHLREALDHALETLLNDIACDVIARELRLEPVNVREIAAEMLERYVSEQPLTLNVHPEDAEALRGLNVPIEIDPTLRRGDIVLHVRNGSIDASLGARLADVLRT